MIKNVLKNKKKNVKELQRNFNLEFIRNATFSVGSHRRTVFTGKNNDKRTIIPYLTKVNHNLNRRYDFLNMVPMIQALEKYDVPAVIVQTDDVYHEGNNSFISLGKQVSNEVALIRKDIFIEPVQIYETKAIGADGVYLNADDLGVKSLKKLLEAAMEMALDVFLELNDVNRKSTYQSIVEEAGVDVFWVLNSETDTMGERFFNRAMLHENPDIHSEGARFILSPGQVNSVEEYFKFLREWLKAENE